MVAAMLAVGAVAGVIAGMFGVGGGTILVPETKPRNIQPNVMAK